MSTSRPSGLGMTFLVGSVLLLFVGVFSILAFMPIKCEMHVKEEWGGSCLACKGTKETSRYKVWRAHRLLRLIEADSK
jgi:hypothetical protein